MIDDNFFEILGNPGINLFAAVGISRHKISNIIVLEFLEYSANNKRSFVLSNYDSIKDHVSKSKNSIFIVDGFGVNSNYKRLFRLIAQYCNDNQNTVIIYDHFLNSEYISTYAKYASSNLFIEETVSLSWYKGRKKTWNKITEFDLRLNKLNAIVNG